MTIKKMYTKFTQGYNGQFPLRELDERFGKLQWRGDSKSKESKRVQLWKKLCEAIEQSIFKYHKSAEKIIQYIEEFREHKSLTWAMNGNLPKDLQKIQRTSIWKGPIVWHCSNSSWPRIV